jgi:hypothetical protein
MNDSLYRPSLLHFQVTCVPASPSRIACPSKIHKEQEKKKSTSSSFLDYILFCFVFWRISTSLTSVLPLCACSMYYYLFLSIRNENGTLLQRATLFSWLPHFHQERTDESQRVLFDMSQLLNKKKTKKKFSFNFFCFVFFSKKKWWRRRSSVFVKDLLPCMLFINFWMGGDFVE